MPDFKSWSRRRLTRLRHELDRLYDDFRCDMGLERDPGRGMTLAEGEDVLMVTIPMTGADPDHVGLTVDEHSLTLELVTELAVTGGVHRETSTRAVALPCAVCPDKATAVLDQGVLTVRLPKRRASCPLHLSID